MEIFAMAHPTAPTSVPPVRRRRWRGWVIGLLSVFGLLLGLGLYMHDLAQPHPERYATGVVTEGAALEAMTARPLARRYLSDFHTQTSGASCGPASLRNVLVSLGYPVASEEALFEEDRAGGWRMRLMGMTLDAVAALAERHGLGRVQILRDLSLEAFRGRLRTLDTPGRRLIVNYSRAPINGVSLGHFSPLGGYDPVTDRVLLLVSPRGLALSWFRRRCSMPPCRPRIR